MEPDPRFPDRPTHPDLDRLSKAVIANDAVTDAASGAEREVYEDYVRQFCEPEVLAYVASERLMRMINASPPQDSDSLLAVMSAGWIDGFMAAAVMLSQTVQDGQRRWGPLAEPVEHPRD